MAIRSRASHRKFAETKQKSPTMDDSNNHATFIVAAAVVVSLLMAAYNIILNDVPKKFEQQMRKRRQHELTPYKRNLSVQYGPPSTELVPQPMLDRLLLDENRAYMCKVHTCTLGSS